MRLNPIIEHAARMCAPKTEGAISPNQSAAFQVQVAQNAMPTIPFDAVDASLLSMDMDAVDLCQGI